MSAGVSARLKILNSSTALLNTVSSELAAKSGVSSPSSTPGSLTVPIDAVDFPLKIAPPGIVAKPLLKGWSPETPSLIS